MLIRNPEIPKHEHLYVERAVDITLNCPRRQRQRDQIVLLYAITEDGRVVFQVVNHYGDVFDGGSWEWYLSRLEDESPKPSEIMITFPLWYGIGVEEFCEMIRRHAPAGVAAGV
jgi:hypothetical protein